MLTEGLASLKNKKLPTLLLINDCNFLELRPTAHLLPSCSISYLQKKWICQETAYWKDDCPILDFNAKINPSLYSRARAAPLLADNCMTLSAIGIGFCAQRSCLLNAQNLKSLSISGLHLDVRLSPSSYW